MPRERRNLDWDLMAEQTEAAVDNVWENIKEITGVGDESFTTWGGYTINRPVFENFPPTIVVRGDINTPETKDTNANKVDLLIESAARQTGDGDFKLKMEFDHIYPHMSRLDKDRVFGTEPDLPPFLKYKLRPDRDKYVLE